MNEQELIKQVRQQQDEVVKEYQELYVNVQKKVESSKQENNHEEGTYYVFEKVDNTRSYFSPLDNLVKKEQK